MSHYRGKNYRKMLAARELGGDFEVGIDLFDNWPKMAGQQRDLDDMDKGLWPKGEPTAQKYLAQSFIMRIPS